MGKIDRDIEERDPKRSVGFAASPVLSGEDPKEFQCLVDELSEQYQPMGPVEKDAVQTMARAIFRKRHLDIFQRGFEARMKWGSFFKFSGDTEGFDRITEQIRQHVTATYIETTTKYAIQMVEGELAKFATDGAEKAKLIPDEADIADEVADTSAADDRNEKNGESSIENWSEAFVKGIVKTAISEIKNKETQSLNRRATRAESTAEIVGRITKAEVEAETERLQRAVPKTFPEQATTKLRAVDKLIACARTLHGDDYTRDTLAQAIRAGIEQLLARLGDLLTSERYAAEMQFNELLDRRIEVCHDRLMKYQAARAKKLSENISSLQPYWALRKR